MFVLGKAVEGDGAVEDRVVAAGDADKAAAKQLLQLDVGRKGAPRADVQVDAARVQGVVFRGAIAFGHEAQHRVRRVHGQQVAQLAAIRADKYVVGAQAESAFQCAQVDFAAGSEDGVRLLHHAAHLLAQFQRARGGRQAAPGAHEDGVADGVADARQGAAHGRGAQMHAPRGGHGAAFLEQDIEGDEQVQVREFHAAIIAPSKELPAVAMPMLRPDGRQENHSFACLSMHARVGASSALAHCRAMQRLLLSSSVLSLQACNASKLSANTFWDSLSSSSVTTRSFCAMGSG